MTTIGRNHPCPCGSGKKYKKCHGNVSHQRHAEMAATSSALARAHQAREILRARAEGYGRPIISTDANDYRFVAVGKRLYYGQNWRFFTDFLLHHMKDVLGRGWGTRMLKTATPHPVLTWLRKMNELRDRQRNLSGVLESRGEGFVTAVFRFAYALYLIAHHDVVPTPLVRRLRQPAQFRDAALETIVVAAFAVAGYKIRMGEDRKGRGPEGEFEATFVKTGKVFNVEAKRKNGWKARNDVASDAFGIELKLWIQRKLYSAARKGLESPIYWFELSINEISDQRDAERLQVLVREAVREAESKLRVAGQAPTPAYVFVTNHAFLANDEASDATLCMLEGFHIEMSTSGQRLEIEKALCERDRDRDAVWILECLQKVQVVPHHFDGTPDDLTDETKAPIPRLQVGELLEVTLPDHPAVRGMVLDVVSQGPEAMVILLNERTGMQEVLTLALTPEEQKAAAALGDVVFGNPSGARKISDDDPLGIYDFFLEAYANSPREKVLEFLSKHPQFDEFKDLPTDDLRTRVCREWAKVAIADHETRVAKRTSKAA